ncbi:MAG: transposase [Chitinophagaceae bacterium]
MPIPVLYRASFVQGREYHIFNRCVEGQLLFYTRENYEFFLRKFQQYISPVFVVRAWCLLPTHFHFFGEVSVPEGLLWRLSSGSGIDQYLTCQFKNFFLSYVQALKKRQGIQTNILAQKYKHREINSDRDRTNLYYYLHHNPLRHGVSQDWEGYLWSSYRQIALGERGLADVRAAWEWFGGREEFIQEHHINAGRYFLDFD